MRSASNTPPLQAAMANFGVKNKGDRGFSANRELSAIYTELWELDENRLTPGKHYRINLQGGQWTAYSYATQYYCNYIHHRRLRGWWM